jgi:hypothetical protein
MLFMLPLLNQMLLLRPTLQGFGTNDKGERFTLRMLSCCLPS